jgi:hypothetical protein
MADGLAAGAGVSFSSATVGSTAGSTPTCVVEVLAAFGRGLRGTAFGETIEIAVGVADGVSIGVGLVAGVSLAAGVRLAAGVSLAAGVGVAAGVGIGVTAGAGVASGGVWIGEGIAARGMGVALGAEFAPPKKCASAPPRSKPAKITTKTSGKSGSPPPESSERRRRRRSFRAALSTERAPSQTLC